MKETILKKTNQLEVWGRTLAFNAKNKMKEFIKDEAGMGTVEIILIIVGICRHPKRCILCGNFYSRL